MYKMHRAVMCSMWIKAFRRSTFSRFLMQSCPVQKLRTFNSNLVSVFATVIEKL